MGSKMRLSSYCTKRANNGVNLVTSRKINMRLARPIMGRAVSLCWVKSLNAIPVIHIYIKCISYKESCKDIMSRESCRMEPWTALCQTLTNELFSILTPPGLLLIVCN